LPLFARGQSDGRFMLIRASKDSAHEFRPATLARLLEGDWWQRLFNWRQSVRNNLSTITLATWLGVMAVVLM